MIIFFQTSTSRQLFGANLIVGRLNLSDWGAEEEI